MVEVDPMYGPASPFEDDVIDAPLPPGAVEVVVGDISVVAVAPADTEQDKAPGGAGETAETMIPLGDAADSWDHLRPHGEVPPLLKPSRAPSRLGQLAALLFSLSAAVAAGIYFYLNTQLDAYSTGQVSAGAIVDLRTVAEASLIVTAGLAVVTFGTLILWAIKKRKTSSLRLGFSGIFALIGMVAGIALITVYLSMSQNTVAEALTNNTYIILGLGVLMTAGLAVVRTIGRIEHQIAT